MKIKAMFSKFWYILTYRFIKAKLTVQSVSFSGDGIFIDIRYWITRPDKLTYKARPYLITANQQRLDLMKLTKFGVMQSKMKKHTNTGILLFYNKNSAIKKGEQFTLCWDNLRAEIVIM